MKTLLLTLIFLSFSVLSFSQQNKQEMKEPKQVRTYNTAGMETKKVENNFNHPTKEQKVKVISKKKFESYPPEKRQAILNNPEKYIIED